MTAHEILASETTLLLAAVDEMDADDLAAASGLPGWTRGHVLGHIAGNAEGLGRRARSVGDGVPRSMYESPEARGADIEWRSRRSVAEHREAIAATHADLLFDIARIPAERSDGDVELRAGLTVSIADLPLLRLQEVSIHHSDLDVPGYGWADWPAQMVAWMLPRVTGSFASRGEFPVGWVDADGVRYTMMSDAATGVSGSATEILAWLTGRAPGAGLEPTGVSAIPRPPTWL